MLALEQATYPEVGDLIFNIYLCMSHNINHYTKFSRNVVLMKAQKSSLLNNEQRASPRQCDILGVCCLIQKAFCCRWLSATMTLNYKATRLPVKTYFNKKSVLIEIHNFHSPIT